MVGNGLYLKHIPSWPTIPRTVGKLGLMSSHIEWILSTSIIMLCTVHFDFRPVYINFKVMNTRKKRLFNRGAISMNTCNICKTQYIIIGLMEVPGVFVVNISSIGAFSLES